MDLIKSLGGLLLIAMITLYASAAVLRVTIRLIMESKTPEEAHSRAATGNIGMWLICVAGLLGSGLFLYLMEHFK